MILIENIHLFITYKNYLMFQLSSSFHLEINVSV